MQVVFEVLCALTSTVPVVDAENLYVGPVRDHRQLVQGVNNVQNNCYSIFVVLSDQAKVGAS